MLDAVPDCVLICSKSKDGSKAQNLYANMKMNNFFGCDIIKASTTKTKIDYNSVFINPDSKKHDNAKKRNPFDR